MDGSRFSRLTELAKRGNGLSQKGKWIVPKGEMEYAKRGNGIRQKGKPIPDINTYINVRYKRKIYIAQGPTSGQDKPAQYIKNDEWDNDERDSRRCHPER